jgi:GNAT superfamily N-acetyltransferase
VERWRVQTREGFQIVYIPEGDTVPAAAGYRFLNTLAWGHILYIDDLVAIAARHKTGLGTTLLQYLQEEARRVGCDAVHLDTGYLRHLAHVAYLRTGFASTVTTSRGRSTDDRRERVGGHGRVHTDPRAAS